MKGGQLEIRRIAIVGRDPAKLVGTLGRPPSGIELEELLEAHPQVSELCAATSVLDELVYRYLTPPACPAGLAAGAAAGERLEEVERIDLVLEEVREA